jgi:threonine/homoserine/homoserine lactone efflux protein
MCGIADYGAFCGAVLLFLALPGPGTLALLTSTTRGGLRAGAAATAGIIVGDQILLWLAVAGVAALLAAHPAWFQAVQWAGAVYLGWLGLRLLWARSSAPASAHQSGGLVPVSVVGSTQGAELPHQTASQALRQALLITVLNPKAIVFYMAFFPLFIDPARHQGLPTFGAMALTIAVITAAYGLALCALAQQVGDAVRRHRRSARWLERLAGLLLIGFGIKLGTS